MQTQAQALPASWVERIWLAMRATYGAAFDRQWECPAGCDPVKHVEGLKAHWARELGVYREKGEAIGYALDNLPPHPPNLIEFKAACNRLPTAAPKALPAPKADPERLAAQLRRLGALKGATNNPRQWAWDLMDRERRQKPKQPVTVREGLTRFQRQAWREALGLPVQMPLAECVIALGLAELEAA